MSLTFEWDPNKAASNAKRHGVTFKEACTAFLDLRSMTIADPDHSHFEDRYVLIGLSAQMRILVVVHTDRGDNVRIISARVADSSERRTYVEA